MKLTKVLALVTAFGLSIVGANAASGIFGSYIQIGGTWYSMQSFGGTLDPLQGADLGTFNVGDSLVINDIEIDTFKNDGSDVTGAAYEWRVYSGAPGSFNAVTVNFEANSTYTSANGLSVTGGGDQNWGSPASTPNILASLTAGDYSLEVFARASSSDGPHFSNNGGANYIATFTVVPEPGTLALFGIGMASLAIARRRRA